MRLADPLMRFPGFESLNHRGPGAKRRVGSGGGLWRVGGLALTGTRLEDLRLPDAGKDRPEAGGKDGLRNLGRDGPKE